MRRSPSRLVAVALAGAATVLLAACGGSSATPGGPKGELSSGVANLTDTDALTVTVKLDTTPAALRRLADSAGGKAHDELSPADARTFAGLSLVIEARTADGKKLSEVKPGDDKAASSSVRLLDNGRTLLELRGVAGNLYLHGDLQAILRLLHQEQAYGHIRSKVASMPAFVQALVAGRWVSLNGSAVKSFAGQLGGLGGSPSQSQSQQLVTDLKQIFTRDTTVARRGVDSRGDHLVITGNMRTLATDFVHAVQSAVPAGSLLGSRLHPGDVPSRTISVDAWVHGGRLAELSVDLLQFAKPSERPAGGHLPLALAFSDTGDDITAPAGAVPVDLTQLAGLLSGLGGLGA